MGTAKRQRTAQAHTEQYRFKLAEDALNAMEAKNFQRLLQQGLLVEERIETE